MFLETITLSGTEKTLSQLKTSVNNGDYNYILAKNAFLYMTSDKGLVKVNTDKSIKENVSVDFPVASKTVAGVTKLYAESGDNTDGAMSQSAIKTELNKKADKGTSLSDYGIGNAYTKTETDTKLGEKANTATTYTKTEVDEAVGKKANTADVYSKTDSDNKYVVKVSGKQLSTNDYTTAEKTKLEGIDEGANKYVLPSDVVQDDSYVHTDTNYTAEDKSAVDTIINKADKSDLDNYVKYQDVPTRTKSGPIKINTANTTGMALDSDGYLKIIAASEAHIDERTNIFLPIVPANLDYAVRSVLPAVSTTIGETVATNCVYDLGEQTSVTLDLPSGGKIGQWIQVDFMSGATATTLTLTSTEGLIGFDLVPQINTIYSLYLDWGIIGKTDTTVNYGWRFSYSEYPVTA